ncbi:Galactoside 2-alpha-L-fucosyltransferase [Dichanthelium oligosanthes]|uniref:Fucosyltransferase n=1 Tax=Dichanthelium oligosanthes TaxID=888268 RepID=A0A1E5VP21_9POAL|nr:Galactoside 2-alpha-L-fucosyltransferase [Dichanthelium oligosanthes]
MQQRKPKVCAAEGAALEIPVSQGAMECDGGWPEAEGARPEHWHLPRKKRLALDNKRWNTVVNLVLVAFVMAVPPVVVVYAGGGVAPAVWIAAAKAQLRRGSGDRSFPYTRSPPDKLLGGLLPDGLDERSCRSRYESSMYRRNPGRRPSPHLITKLRKHEELQRRCGPNTDAYNRAIQQLRSGKSVGSPECKYVVSISYRGLGNRILAAASAFLYAVLTDRVLLVDPSNEMDGLFCEPFPGTTWLLPRDFPLASYTNFSIDTAESYGNMLKNKVLSADVPVAPPTAELPAFAYLHLDHDYAHEDKMFFCDDDQRLLSNVQWLVMRTDLYTVPGLFLVTAFQEELDALFPERDAVFHHLARYLFHPTNHVWGLVTRYYRAYLARAELRVGIQVRNFNPRHAQSPHVLRQITNCVWREKLLPEVLATEEHAVPTPGAKFTAVLITSLRPWYYERIKGMYWDHATATGEDVSVHQPSHEGQQQFGKKWHDGRAWAEMYLLSLCDVLVTSGWSTFGYVAQGFGAVRPWVLHKQPENLTSAPDPPCFRDVSMEPCFHAPHVYDCKRKRGLDTGEVLPHVRHCQDVSWGLKLVDPKLYKA